MIANPTNELAGGLTAEQRLFDHIRKALRVMVDWRAPSVSLERKQSGVRFALRSFCRHLERLMSFEEQGGYLTTVTESRPNWEVHVGRLKTEHSRLRERIQRLTPQIDDASAWRAERFESACIAIRELLDEVEQHDREEIALLQDTLLFDEGGEG